MKNGVCVGGLVQNSLMPVRLIPPGALCNPNNTDYEIGDIWEVNATPRAGNTPPHVEDHDVQPGGTRVDSLPNLRQWLLENIEPWHGEPQNLFEGAVRFRQTGTAYVSESGPLPHHSTGFWVLPRVMEYSPFIDNDGKEHPKYSLNGIPTIVLPYVGLADPIQHIAAGTLVRLSLSRPWKSASNVEERQRHSVQLSGWF